MHRQDLRPATRKASERTPGSKLGTRLSKGEKRSRKRMATVAAVYLGAHARAMLAVLSPRRLKSPRGPDRSTNGWASLEQEPREVLQEAFREALQRDRQGNQRLVDDPDAVDHLSQAGRASTECNSRCAGHLSRAEYLCGRVGGKAASRIASRVRRARHVMRRRPKRRLATRKREPVDRCANPAEVPGPWPRSCSRVIGSGVIALSAGQRPAGIGARWRLRALRRCCASRFVQVVISTTTGSSTRRRSGSVPIGRLRRRTGAVAPAAEQRAPPAHRPGLAAASSGPSPLAHHPNNLHTDSPAYVAARASVTRAFATRSRCAASV